MADSIESPPPATNIDVSIVIPVFNKWTLTDQCLSTLDRHTTRRLRWEVIVVDNASTDETPIQLKQCQSLYSWLRVIRNEENLGFSKACNQGVEASAAPAILLLNNDIEITQEWLEPLFRTLYADPEVAAVGSKLLFGHGTIQHAGVILLDHQGLNDPLVANHIYWNEPRDLAQTLERRTYSALTGACLLMKRAAFDQVGQLDTEFWNGYEDVDLCLKLRKKGWLCVYEPESELIHHESQSGPERFRKVAHNVARLHERWLDRVRPDFFVDADGTISVMNPLGVRPYRGADGVSFTDVLTAVRKSPVSADSMDIPTISRRQTEPTPATPLNPGNYNVVLVSPEGYEHSGTFVELADLLVESLRSMGYQARCQANIIDPGSVNIILGYHLVPVPEELRKAYHVIYQLEQLSDEEGWYRSSLFKILSSANEVWDYAPENIQFLARRGLSSVQHVPIGYHAKLRRIRRSNQDIDVLFYGSLNPRRLAILEEIGKFATVKCLTSIYGADRDEYIARSKIVLNLHYYEAQIMEQVRLAYLFNNHVFVISEESPNNQYADFLVSMPAEKIAETVRHYLQSPAERYAQAKLAHAQFRQRSMADYLSRVITLPPMAKRETA